jgi:hypothetical protein
MRRRPLAGKGEQLSRQTMRHAFVAISVVAASLTVPVAMATSASATPSQCESYLSGKGYTVGNKVAYACNEAANYSGATSRRVAHDKCSSELRAIGVASSYASTACTRAQQ